MFDALNKILAIGIALLYFSGYLFWKSRIDGKFPIKKIWYPLAYILPVISILFSSSDNLVVLATTASIEAQLVLLAGEDIDWLEIDGFSYLPIAIPALIQFCTFPTGVFFTILTPIFMYVTLFIFDKIIGIENIGGADCKLLLLLSFVIPADGVVDFVIGIAATSILLFIIYAIKNKRLKVQIPMIVSIMVAYFLYFFVHGSILF